VTESKPKVHNRFVVHHPRFPTHIINGFSIELDELRLKFYIVQEQDVLDFFKREKLDSIEVIWLNDKGNEIDHIKFHGCRVKEVNCMGDWSLDSPLEVMIVYEVGTMGKR
jgi:penicillin-binding protein-related factor A (putative recombinase)